MKQIRRYIVYRLLPRDNWPIVNSNNYAASLANEMEEWNFYHFALNWLRPAEYKYKVWVRNKRTERCFGPIIVEPRNQTFLDATAKEMLNRGMIENVSEMEVL